MNLKWHQRKTLRLVLAAIIVGVALAAGWVWHYHTSPRHFLEVTPGVLYRSATLRPAKLELVLNRHRIRTVVNLRPVNPQDPPAWYREEAAICRRLGVQLVDLPLYDYEVPSADQIAAWVTLLGQKERLPVLVHCNYGVVRTGFMVAIYEIRSLGKDPRRALADMPAFGHELSQAELTPIRDMVLGLAPRVSVGGAPRTDAEK